MAAIMTCVVSESTWEDVSQTTMSRCLTENGFFHLTHVTTNKMAQPDQELVVGLREEVLQYKMVDDRLRALNGQIYPLREQRKLIEDRIVHIVRQPAFAAINELAISQDGSKIRIRKPQMWFASWSLPKSRMRELLNQYFASGGVLTAAGCFAFIIDTQNASLRQDKYAIERVVPDADE